ncbi:MAG TPA: hypothetical protein VF366_07570, partial [Dehalococcoidia bacterium]
RLNFPKTSAQAMRQTLQLKKQLHKLDNPRLKSSDIYRLLQGYSPPAIYANVAASKSPIVIKHLNLYLDKLRYVKLLLNGSDLLKMGIPSGPKVGQVLDTLLKAKLNGEVRTRKDEEKLVSHFR